jgi:hypothetical protein
MYTFAVVFLKDPIYSYIDCINIKVAAETVSRLMQSKKVFVLLITHSLWNIRTRIYIISNICLHLQLKTDISNNMSLPNRKHCPAEGENREI